LSGQRLYPHDVDENRLIKKRFAYRTSMPQPACACRFGRCGMY
jgi:hypothetical protein